MSVRSRRVASAYLAAAEALRPNAGQWAAYESRGHCVVLAGPGSGKTKTLTVKLARMLAEDVRTPASVACITYSQETARELEARLGGLGVRDAPGLFVGTVHGFCLKHLLTPYALLAGLPVPWPLVVATSAQAEAAFSRAISSIYGQGRGPYTAHDVGKMRRAHVDDLAGMDAADSDLARLVGAYKEELLAAGVLDYDDLVLFSHRLVCDYEWVLRAVRAKLPILAVDEYQDLGVPLDRIVRRLAFAGGVRLFAVGDADQSVYGFAGADGSLLAEMSARDGVETVHLDLNYRSAGGIIRMSELALGEVRGYIPSDAERPATTEAHKCPGGQGEQAERAVTMLIPQALAAKPGRRLGDIAVLYRNAALGTTVAAELDRAGVSYIRSDAAAAYKRVAATSWLEDLAAWCDSGWRVGSPSFEALCGRHVGLWNVRKPDRARRDITRRLMRFLWPRL